MAIAKDASMANEKSSPVPYDEAVGDVEVRGNADSLQRHLGNRQIQMIAIGGSIGTALFVTIGGGLMDGGPGSLLIAYALYSCLLGLVNNCMAEMAVYMPVSGMLRAAPAGIRDKMHWLTQNHNAAQAPLSASLENGSTMPLASCPAGTSTSTKPA